MGGARILAAGRLITPLMLSVAAALISCSQGSGTVTGPVVEVDGDLSEVISFTLLVDGDEWEFLPVEDGDHAFPLQHLREHQRSGEPVAVRWEARGSARYALSLDDG